MDARHQDKGASVYLCCAVIRAISTTTRVVTLTKEKRMADEYGVQFFETSALTGHNVEKMFTAVIGDYDQTQN
jgi:hypothetical protein